MTNKLRKNYDCYHGTIKYYSDNIFKEKKFTFKERNDHWLGNGVYFFIDDSSKAKWWSGEAVKLAKRNPKLTLNKKQMCPKVIYLKVDVCSSELLNLDTEEGLKLLMDFYNYLRINNFRVVKRKNGNEQSENSLHEARCHVLDLLVKSEGFKACTYTFDSEKKNLYNSFSSFGLVNRSRQLSVYDQSIINFEQMTLI